MDMFKTRVGEARFIMINEDNFFTETGDRPPYRATGRNGSPVRYAVCPACDNPIVLVGLYRREQDGRAWLNYDATYHNLPQMLFWGGGVTSLYGQSVLRDGPVARRLAHARGVVLEPCPLDGYVRVGTTRFMNVDFSLGSRKTRIVDDHLEESYLLRVSVDGRRTGADIPIAADPERFDAILNMNGWHDNGRLLGIASSVL